MGLLDRLFGPPSPDVFARELMTAMRRAGERGDLVYEREGFRILRPKDKGVTNLSTVYAEHCALPRQARKQHLQQLAAAFIAARDELPSDFDDARPHVRPKVWTRGQFALMDLQQRLSGGKELNIPLYPLGEHLLTSIVYDRPTSMRTLSHEDLERWNVSYYEAMELARQNLDETTTAWATLEGAGHVLHSAMTGDNYDSARVLLIDRIAAFPLEGEPIAMIPARDALYVTGSDDVDGLQAMLQFAGQSLADDPRPLSGVPLRLSGGEWEDWQPPADHPHAEGFSWLRQMFLGTLYTDQQGLLNAIHEKEELDVFVASYSAVENPKTGEKRSYCVWSEGVDSLLPQTQYVMLPTANTLDQPENHGPTIGGEWTHVRQVAGDLMQLVPNLYPPRWRVREFPSQQQLEQIGPLEL